eukprot:1570331-Pyramimonas_sp.AAC.1
MPTPSPQGSHTLEFSVLQQRSSWTRRGPTVECPLYAPRQRPSLSHKGTFPTTYQPIYSQQCETLGNVSRVKASSSL